TGGARAALKLRFAQNEARDRAVHDPEHTGQRLGISCKQEPQRKGERQHPLAQRLARQHLIGEECRGFRHSPTTAARAEPAFLAAEGDGGTSRADLRGATALDSRRRLDLAVRILRASARGFDTSDSARAKKSLQEIEDQIKSDTFFITISYLESIVLRRASE